MNIVQSRRDRPNTAPDYPYRLARKIWALTFAVVAVVHFTLWRPNQAVNFHDGPAPILLAVLAAATLGYGLAAITALLITNWPKKRTVLWPTKGKLIGAFTLAFVTPLAVFSGVPWIVGGMLLFTAPMLPPAFETLLVAAQWTLVPTAAWYIPSALIISGTRSHKLRFGLFCVMFWSCYAAHILYTGLKTFRL